jgi:hypothetical protein
MARPLPVTARDILAQVELASRLGLIRNAVTIANDASASLGQKVALFGASAVMTSQDREWLDGLLVAVEGQQRRLQTPRAHEQDEELGAPALERQAVDPLVAARSPQEESATVPFSVAAHASR